MVATVEIDESNTVGETITHGITNLNFGITDVPNLVVSSTTRIPAGENAYEKWLKYDVTGGTFNQIDNLKVFKSAGALKTGETLDTNARETAYGGAETFVTPTRTTSTVATQTLPASEPAGANLGIGGSLSGNLTAVGKSDYCVIQMQTTASTPPGAVNQKTMIFQYDEQ